MFSQAASHNLDVVEENEAGDATSAGDDQANEELDMELYFTDPHQLLDIFLELEEQNLSLIQNSQDAEEVLEQLKKTIDATRNKMEKETELLKNQIAQLNAQIKKEVEKEADLKLKISLYNVGEVETEEQESLLEELKLKVEKVYTSCIGSNEANISTLQMLTNIENRLEDLFQKIEQMPPDKVEEAEKSKEKERRMKQREERIVEQKKSQEERMRKALERARAEPKKYVNKMRSFVCYKFILIKNKLISCLTTQTGRRLMIRSKPPASAKIDKRALDEANKIDEEMAYFFT